MLDRDIKDAVERHREADLHDAAAASRAAGEPALAAGLASVLWDSLWDPKQYSALGAEWRRGLKDLQTVVLGPWGGSHNELGTIANPTPQLITDEIQGKGQRMPSAATPEADFEREMRSHAARIPEEPDQGPSIDP